MNRPQPLFRNEPRAPRSRAASVAGIRPKARQINVFRNASIPLNRCLPVFPAAVLQSHAVPAFDRGLSPYTAKYEWTLT